MIHKDLSGEKNSKILGCKIKNDDTPIVWHLQSVYTTVFLSLFSLRFVNCNRKLVGFLVHWWWWWWWCAVAFSLILNAGYLCVFTVHCSCSCSMSYIPKSGGKYRSSNTEQCFSLIEMAFQLWIDVIIKSLFCAINRNKELKQWRFKGIQRHWRRQRTTQMDRIEHKQG